MHLRYQPTRTAANDEDSAPVCANRIASAVLASISEDDKHYPFIRDTSPACAWSGNLSDDDLDFLFHQAKDDLEIAEGRMPQGYGSSSEIVFTIKVSLHA